MTNLAELRDFEQGVLFLHDDIGILRNVVTQFLPQYPPDYCAWGY